MDILAGEKNKWEVRGREEKIKNKDMKTTQQTLREVGVPGESRYHYKNKIYKQDLTFKDT